MKHERAFQAIGEPPTAFMVGDGIVVHVADEGEHFWRKVGLDVGREHASVEVLAKELFVVVELIMAFFELFSVIVSDIFEVVVAADDQHQVLALEALLEAVHVVLVQVSDFVDNKHHKVQLRVVFQIDVHGEHYLPHLALAQVNDAHLRRRVLREDLVLLLLELLGCDLEEIGQLVYLVPSELDGDDEPDHAVLKLIVTVISNIFDQIIEEPKSQQTLDIVALGHDVCELCWFFDGVRRGPHRFELVLLLVLHE